MSLNKVNYVDGVTVITAQNMNDIQDAIIDLESGGGSGVTSVNGKTGVVVLTASDVGAGTYSKPSGGIPKSDLASAVQTSLGKADTALQSVPSTYRTAAAQDTIDDAQDTAISGKLDKNQGVDHAGEFCVVGADGNITTQAMTNAETEAM